MNDKNALNNIFNDSAIAELKLRFSKLQNVGTDNQKDFYNSFEKDNSKFLEWFDKQYGCFFENEFEYTHPRLLKSKIISDKDLWRISSYNGMEKKHLSNLMPPDDDLLPLIELGRCNYPFNPVFYANNTISGCLFERFKDGYSGLKPLNIVLSKWHLKETHDLMMFSSKGKCHNEIFNNLYNRIFQLLEEKYEMQDFEKYCDYLGEIFLNEDDYTGSSFLAQCFLYSPPPDNHSAIVFPSVRNTKSFNIAINKHITGKPDRFFFLEAFDIDLINFSFDSKGNGIIEYKFNNTLVTNNQFKLTEKKHDLAGKVNVSEIREYEIIPEIAS